MRYPQKERQPSVDHDNIDLILMGAVPHPDEESIRHESPAELLRFMDIWVRLQAMLQSPVQEDSAGLNGHTGYRNVALDETGTLYALGFGLSANYGRLDTHMRISAYLRRVYDENTRLEHYESEEVHLYSGDRYDVNSNAARAAEKIEHLLGLYVAAPVSEETF